MHSHLLLRSKEISKLVLSLLNSKYNRQRQLYQKLLSVPKN